MVSCSHTAKVQQGKKKKATKIIKDKMVALLDRIQELWQQCHLTNKAAQFNKILGLMKNKLNNSF